MKLKIKFFVCDTPARSFLKGVVSHVSFSACERCEVAGKKVHGVTVFEDTNARRRSEESFHNFTDPKHHNYPSPLIAVIPKLNLINQFVLDPMHLLYLGCTKRLLEFLLMPSKTHKSQLSAGMKIELDRRSKLMEKDIPIDFQRKMRSLSNMKDFKAVEFKFFINYAAPIIFKKSLSSESYQNL